MLQRAPRARQVCGLFRAKGVRIMARAAKAVDEAVAAGEVRSLVESMPRRLRAVLDADGGPINY